MLSTEHRASGLIVARDSMDEASVQRELKRLDGRLVLQRHRRDNAPSGHVYKVILNVSERYAPIVFTWIDAYGNPLPLSSGLVDEFRRHMADSRDKPETADEHNARLLEEQRRDLDRETDAIIEDHMPYLQRKRLSVSLSTGKPRYWRRENTRPSSGVDDAR